MAACSSDPFLPIGHHLPPLAAVGGALSVPQISVCSSLDDNLIREFEERILTMQGGDNGGSSTNTRDNNHLPDGVPFIVDSGATVHATGNPALFSSLEGITTTMILCMANGSTVSIIGRGTVRHHNITLHDVLFAPGLALNIVSVSKLGELDYTVEFTRNSCFIRDADTGDLVGKAHLVNGLFELDFLNTQRS